MATPKMRSAIVAAATVEVLCPWCGEGQPNPDNCAFAWMPAEVQANQGTRECVSCEQKFRLHAQSKVPLYAEEPPEGFNDEPSRGRSAP